MDHFCNLCLVSVVLFLSVHCSLVVSCCESADLLALLYAMFSSVFVTFPSGVLGEVWFFVVSILDLSLLPYSG